MSLSVSHHASTTKTVNHSSVASMQLTGWVYWQREPARAADCWTKAFAVLHNAFLWLFQREESVPHNLLVQLAVADVELAEDGQMLCVIDPSGEQLRFCVRENAAFESRSSRLKDAADLTEAFFQDWTYAISRVEVATEQSHNQEDKVHGCGGSICEAMEDS
ncbi:hypothetical protein GN244_ATG11031 [Phytophthora infestans]|uniref:PH domain-containing protein n=1 Tax=Phytophthora infestans TaxID=4787 RepID=A0A833WC87_PHYIN|nr:hypothetical protein GN244_ATG11031 [Phytophthora infestans]